MDHRLTYISKIKKIFVKIIFITGIITSLFIFLLSVYYFSSGMYERYKPSALIKKIDNIILYRYLGFSIYEIDKYIEIKTKSLKYLIFNNELENVQIIIDQENQKILDLQRKNKLEKISEEVEKYSKAKLNFKDQNYKIKMRVKGDRTLHWYDKNQTSYKIDLRGDERIWGMEEFSVQKPITRNYIYEYIFHKVLEFNNLISLKYFFVNLQLNSNDKSIYAVEESFSKELIERNKRRNGPIFGIDEQLGVHYPLVTYDLYSKNYWEKNNLDLTNSALSKLNNLKKDNTKFDKNFDLKKWAKFFAVIDLTNTYHGAIPKSTKLYYNTVTGKFEPIGYDGHYNANLFKNFLIIDFLDADNTNCDYICSDREWFLKFLKNKDKTNNTKFITLYIDSLKELTSDKFLSMFEEKYSKQISFYNSQLLSDKSKKDLVMYKGIGPYIYDKSYLSNRSNYIKKRITELNSLTNKENLSNEGSIKRLDILDNQNIKFINGEYFLISDLLISKNYYLEKNKKLNINKGVNLIFKKDVNIFSEGSIFFEGTKENPIVIYGEKNIGSITLSNNIFKFNNVIIKNLSYPKNKDKILYGGINIINSNVEITEAQIISSSSEDAINIVSSNSVIKNLYMSGIKSDAIDIDFGTLNFENISCENVLNDCLDVSGAVIDGKFLMASGIKDKALSLGENSKGKISNIKIQDSKLGIAVKDGSELELLNFTSINNEYDIAVFNKKKEYGESRLYYNQPIDEKNFRVLLGKNNKIILKNGHKIKKITNNYINKLFY